MSATEDRTLLHTTRARRESLQSSDSFNSCTGVTSVTPCQNRSALETRTTRDSKSASSSGRNRSRALSTECSTISKTSKTRTRRTLDSNRLQHTGPARVRYAEIPTAPTGGVNNLLLMPRGHKATATSSGLLARPVVFGRSCTNIDQCKLQFTTTRSGAAP